MLCDCYLNLVWCVHPCVGWDKWSIHGNLVRMIGKCHGWRWQAQLTPPKCREAVFALASSQPLWGNRRISKIFFTSISSPWVCTIASKVRLYHLVLIVTRQRVLLFSPLGYGKGEREREEHSILPLEIFFSLLLANVLFLINKFQGQG